MLNHPAVKRPVRTRMLGVVGRAGEKPALTRLDGLPTGSEHFKDSQVDNMTVSY